MFANLSIYEEKNKFITLNINNMRIKTLTGRRCLQGAMALFFSFISVLGAMAQTVSGVVSDVRDSFGLPGVSILVKGTTIGTVTDLDGNYTLDEIGRASCRERVSSPV